MLKRSGTGECRIDTNRMNTELVSLEIALGLESTLAGFATEWPFSLKNENRVGLEVPTRTHRQMSASNQNVLVVRSAYCVNTMVKFQIMSRRKGPDAEITLKSACILRRDERRNERLGRIER